MSDEKYKNGKIYTIRNKNDDTLIYVGSTISQLSRRLYDHKKDSKKTLKYPNHKLYSIIETWDDWYIELYELFPCNTKEELNKREGELIREIGTLNRCVAGRTQKEYEEDNKDKIKEYKKGQRIKEFEAGNIRQIKHVCGCGGSYSAKSIREHERTKKHFNFLKTKEAPE